MFLDRIFLKRNRKFFVVFDELAAGIRNMSRLLYRSMTDGAGHIGRHVAEMEDVEQDTATQVRSLYAEAGRNIITPYDREDIHYLASGLRSIARHTLRVTKQIRNYRIDCTDDLAREVARQAGDAMGMLAQVLSGLKQTTALAGFRQTCAEIRATLQKSGAMLDNAIALLVSGGSGEVHIIKMMVHYSALQKMLQKTGSTVDVCESIILKYS